MMGLIRLHEGLRSVFTLGSASADGGRDALDGRQFDGIVVECGKTSGDADSLIFQGGRFRSTACDRYEYGDGAYTVIAAGDTLTFSAETESPKYGTLRWHGVVRGRRLDGTLTMVRDGQVLGEKWVIAGQAG
ncbi:MAG TPA: hypothetical protein VFU71_21430 [Burkholderiaceae bacterium]|nr:hypothetical protein [Burkholderiaceae bacterium]